MGTDTAARESVFCCYRNPQLHFDLETNPGLTVFCGWPLKEKALFYFSEISTIFLPEELFQMSRRIGGGDEGKMPDGRTEGLTMGPTLLGFRVFSLIVICE